MVIMPKKIVGGLVAVIASTLNSGLVVVDVGKQAATVMMPIVKDVAVTVGRATWEGGKDIVRAVPTYLVSMVGSPMKFILTVAVKHPIGFGVLTAGISISVMVTERIYTFLYVNVPESLSDEDAEHVTRAFINVLRGGASVLGSGGEVLEEVAESIRDAIVQTKATLGSAAFGYTTAAFLGVAVSLYIGLESNRMKSAKGRPPAKRVKRS
jgi:hypothetical protein